MVHVVKKASEFLLLVGLACLTLPPMAVAGDTGCLTCHQYPGLVRLEKTGAMKVLHIDSGPYFNSPHGELGCRECHTPINKVPHAGENKTTCQTASCHASKKDKELLSANKEKKIHAGQQSALTHVKAQSSCNLCHPIYPHSKEVFARVILNLHTTYIICEVCHYKKEEFDKVSYDWITTDEIKFVGKSFGSFYDPRKKSTAKITNTLSRIAPFVIKDGKKTLLMTSWDMGNTRVYEHEKTKMNQQQKKTGMQYLHRDIGKMEVVKACDACHAKQGMLNFSQLGFSETRIQHLLNINTKGLLQKYETFYMPSIFRQNRKNVD